MFDPTRGSSCFTFSFGTALIFFRHLVSVIFCKTVIQFDLKHVFIDLVTPWCSSLQNSYFIHDDLEGVFSFVLIPIARSLCLVVVETTILIPISTLLSKHGIVSFFPSFVEYFLSQNNLYGSREQSISLSLLRTTLRLGFIFLASSVEAATFWGCFLLQGAKRMVSRKVKRVWPSSVSPPDATFSTLFSDSVNNLIFHVLGKNGWQGGSIVKVERRCRC